MSRPVDSVLGEIGSLVNNLHAENAALRKQVAKEAVESNRLLREKNAELERFLAPDSLHARYHRLDDKLREILDIPEETKDPLAEIEARTKALVAQARAAEYARHPSHAVPAAGAAGKVVAQSWAGVGATKPEPKLPGERNRFRKKIYKALGLSPLETDQYVVDYICSRNRASRDLMKANEELHHRVRELEKRVVAVPSLDAATLLMAEQAREQDLKVLKRNLADAGKTLGRISCALDKFVPEADKVPLYDMVEQIEKLGAKAAENEDLALKNPLSKTLDGLREKLSVALDENESLSEKLDASRRIEQAVSATAQKAMSAIARMGAAMGMIVGPTLDLPRIEQGVKSLAETVRLLKSSTYGKTEVSSGRTAVSSGKPDWALETFKSRMLAALCMDGGSEDIIVDAVVGLRAKASGSDSLRAQCHQYEEDLRKLNQKERDHVRHVARLKTVLNAAYGKFGTKAEGELPTLVATEIRTILDGAGLKAESLVEGVRSLAMAVSDLRVHAQRWKERYMKDEGCWAERCKTSVTDRLIEALEADGWREEGADPVADVARVLDTVRRSHLRLDELGIEHDRLHLRVDRVATSLMDVKRLFAR